MKNAVEWALTQKYVDVIGAERLVRKDSYHQLVDKVREYFNGNNIEYETFSYEDLIPYLD